MSNENETASTEETPTKPRKPRTNTNPNNLPSPSASEFIYNWNIVADENGDRNAVVERLKKLGFHMTYQALSQRVQNYAKNPGLEDLMKPLTKSHGKKVDADEVAAELALLVEADSK